MTEDKRQLIIYHARCMDGLAAYWAALKRWPEAEGVPAHYGNPPPYELAQGRDVLIVDFSYPRRQLLELHSIARSLQVLDHHKTAQADLESLDFCSFDMDKSGSRLAWEWAGLSGPVPYLIQYVEDRDLWRWKLPKSREINAYLRSLPMTLETLSDADQALLFMEGQELYAQCGEAILRSQNQMVRQHLGRAECWVITLPDGREVEVWAVNASVLSSEIAGSLASAPGSPGIGMVYYRMGSGEWLYNLRSTKDVDCSFIAQALGGGGHSQACGFKGPMSPDQTVAVFKSLGPIPDKEGE